MIYYVCRSNVLTSHKFFTKPPKHRVDYNAQAGCIDHHFDPRPGDELFELYHFERLFPAFAVQVGECSVINIEMLTSVATGIMHYYIELLETNKKLKHAF